VGKKAKEATCQTPNIDNHNISPREHEEAGFSKNKKKPVPGTST